MRKKVNDQENKGWAIETEKRAKKISFKLYPLKMCYQIEQ